jgi:hypothetical protein
LAHSGLPVTPYSFHPPIHVTAGMMPMTRLFAHSAVVVLAVVALAAAPPEPKGKARLVQVKRASLEVTDGKVEEKKDGFLTITSPEVRAVEEGPPARAARLVFTYNGQPDTVAKLASGDVAYQVGLELRAMNTCNLLYVMWKLDDRPRIAVSVKRNPDQSTHKECGANGYVGIKATAEAPPQQFPNGKDGKPHTLDAEVVKLKPSGYGVLVKIDGQEMWEGVIEGKLLDDIDGPAGFRTDNCKITFKFYSQIR